MADSLKGGDGTVETVPLEEAVVSAGVSSGETGTPHDLQRLAMLLALGWLGTNLALSIAGLPLKFLLKDQLLLGPPAIAAFFALGNFTNYIKPVAGILTDAIPFMGTRRRHYLLLGIGGGGLFWLLLGVVPRTYGSLLLTYAIFYVTVVLTSTTLGGRMVEVGNQYRAAGRLTAQRIATFRMADLVGGPVGGFLAYYPFGLTVALSAGIHFALVILIYQRLQEPATARRNRYVWQEAGAQLRILARSRTLLAAAGLVFLLAISPGFGTPLFFYQTNVLALSKQFIGYLGFVSAAFGLLGAWAYYAFCRRLRLRDLLAWSIVIHTFGTMLHLWYYSPMSAMIITAANGITGALAMLPIYDLAARATPRGSEALGYSVMMSVWNLTNALSDWSGSWLYDRFHLTFRELVWLNAGTTALVLFAVPLLPAVLMRQRDGE